MAAILATGLRTDEANCNSTVERAADAYFYYSQQNLITGTAIAEDVFEEVSTGFWGRACLVKATLLCLQILEQGKDSVMSCETESELRTPTSLDATVTPDRVKTPYSNQNRIQKSIVKVTFPT